MIRQSAANDDLPPTVRLNAPPDAEVTARASRRSRAVTGDTGTRSPGWEFKRVSSLSGEWKLHAEFA